MESNGSRLAAAYARLSGAGRRVTVRSLKAEAGCSTDAAAGFLRDVGGPQIGRASCRERV